MLSENLPAVGIPACNNEVGEHDGYTVVGKYVSAVAEGASALPLVLPPLGRWYADAPGGWAGLVARLDGVLLTGAPSNVAVHHYGGTEPPDGMETDPARDATNLPLIEACLAHGVPLLAICRGFQELNVVLGGTLHPRLDRVVGRDTHHEDVNDPLDVQYGPSHRVALTPGGVLAGLYGDTTTMVNSVHTQGIAELAPRLALEAEAPDGTVEAARVSDSPAFALGVQWHPEWRFAEKPLSKALLAHFGAACRERARNRQASPAPAAS